MSPIASAEYGSMAAPPIPQLKLKKELLSPQAETPRAPETNGAKPVGQNIEGLTADMREKMAKYQSLGFEVKQMGDVWVADDGEGIRQL